MDIIEANHKTETLKLPRLSILESSMWIWVITNIVGSLIMVIKMATISSGDGKPLWMIAFFFIFLFYGGIYSFAAIPFSYLNLLIVKKIKTNYTIFQYLYIIFSVALFTILLFHISSLFINGKLSDYRDYIKFFGIHTIVGIITTLFFTWRIIEPNSLSENTKIEE